jgi:hypothetical protein
MTKELYRRLTCELTRYEVELILKKIKNEKLAGLEKRTLSGIVQVLEKFLKG